MGWRLLLVGFVLVLGATRASAADPYLVLKFGDSDRASVTCNVASKSVDIKLRIKSALLFRTSSIPMKMAIGEAEQDLQAKLVSSDQKNVVLFVALTDVTNFLLALRGAKALAFKFSSSPKTFSLVPKKIKKFVAECATQQGIGLE